MTAVQGEAATRQVTIHRDDWGVPHIYAAREEDGFWGLGYAQAEDKLEALLLRYLWVRGELSATFGPQWFDCDCWQLRWRVLDEGRRGFARLSGPLQGNYRAFIAGIRAYMGRHPERVPSWAPPLEPALPIALEQGFRSYEQVFPALRALKAAGIAPDDWIENESRPPSWAALGQNSNQMALLPWRTADNAVILINDPHTSADGAEIFECRIEAGDLKSCGVAVVGQPLPLIGHNRFVGWAETTGAPAVSDCYVVETDPAEPRRYRYDDEWRTVEARGIQISARDGTALRRTCEYTEHNGIPSPVVARSGTRAYAVCNPYLPIAGRWDEQLYRQHRATSVAELREAMALCAIHPQNILAGDVHGDVLYVRSGRTPIRAAGIDWTRPVPGNTSATAWRGIHPLDDLVQCANPAQGYIQNNNVAPDTMTSDCPVRAAHYPAYLFNDTPGRTTSRGKRALHLLGNTFRATLDDAIAIALDERWPETAAWQAALRRAIDRNTGVVRAGAVIYRTVLARLLAFDGEARPESVAALNYWYWFREIWAHPFVAALSAATLDRWLGGEPVPEEQELADLLLDSVERAIATMQRLHGSTELRYGDVFRVGRGGFSWPARAGTLECAARTRDYAAPLRVTWLTEPDARGQRWVSGGGRFLQLMVLTPRIRSFSAILFGQSGDPASPHYSDQARLLSERRLKPTYFYREELLPHVITTAVHTIGDDDE